LNLQEGRPREKHGFPRVENVPLRLSLYDHRDGTRPMPGHRVVYDVARDAAGFGAVGAEGRALVWELSEYGGEGAKLAAEIELDRSREWLMRCDRVDFPAGSVAYRHVHPGPGIRCLLAGSLTIATDGGSRTYGPGEAWFEDAEYPVVATASEAEATAFVRVMLLPREWAGKRSIRYLDPADEERPKLQRARLFLEEPIAF
jgi:hypothetical protein